ncbi:FAD-binding protein [Mailhella sp.]|uniref:FAD-binding protein n=1 Tax=Mailhella sp. TaxID=1981029 RepID=UPI003AB41960
MIPIQNEMTCDVLCVGGGIAALQASIAAAEEGSDVLLVDKAHPRRSGSGATGCDHFGCYLPEVHGDDINVIVREILGSQTGTCHDPRLTRRFLKESTAMVHRWESWGIPMRPKGFYEFKGHAFPTRPRAFLHYDGRQQKPILYKKAGECGVRFLPYSPVVDFVFNEHGQPVGALALRIDQEDPGFTLIRSRTIVLATGVATRLYSSATSPGMLFNLAYCGSCTGTGISLVWRNGGHTLNMEIPYIHAGPKHFARCGKASFIGVARYPDGSPVGPFVTEPDKDYGDVTLDVSHRILTERLCDGRGPIYVDCHGAPEAWLDEMREALRWEGVAAMLDHMDEEGIDFSRHAIEFMQYEPHVQGRGVEIDENGETSIPNVYAAGDIVGNFRVGVSGAAVYGWICGKSAARKSKDAPSSSSLDQNSLDAACDRCSRIYDRRGSGGATWREANIAVQTLMSSYAPVPPHKARSANLLCAGLKYMKDLRAKLDRELSADNPHELMRALEVYELLDCGEAIMHAALERKESRGNHVRSDYTLTNPLLSNKFLIMTNRKGIVAGTWREKWN